MEAPIGAVEVLVTSSTVVSGVGVAGVGSGGLDSVTNSVVVGVGIAGVGYGGLLWIDPWGVDVDCVSNGVSECLWLNASLAG